MTGGLVVKPRSDNAVVSRAAAPGTREAFATSTTPPSVTIGSIVVVGGNVVVVVVVDVVVVVVVDVVVVDATVVGTGKLVTTAEVEVPAGMMPSDEHPRRPTITSVVAASARHRR